MSTRCQIEFKHVTKYANRKRPIIERRTVYRHSDGYPDGVIPDLKDFLKWNAGRNDDIEYQAANFIYWSKRRKEESYWKPQGSGIYADEKMEKWSDVGSTNCSILHTGFGICENDGFHGDIEYFYEVIYETTDIKPREEYVVKAYINIYEVKLEDWKKPVKRENLKLIKKVEIKQRSKTWHGKQK